MIANLVEIFEVDVIITHKYDESGTILVNGPLVVINNDGNVVRSIS